MARKGRNKRGKAAPAASKVETTAEIPDDGVSSPSHRTVTGVLASHPLSRDIKIENFSLSLHGLELVKDTMLELNWGRRYGLVGHNGCGKSTLMRAIGSGETCMPEFIDYHLVSSEAPASDMTSIEFVLETLEKDRKRVEDEMEELMVNDPENPRMEYLYEKLDEMEVQTAETRAAKILFGLGFTHEMQHKKTKEFSGGWRMRIALAKGLFIKPSMLLLDEPTNHLDLEACVWLERYLSKFDRILVMVSHSQDFLNNVCTNTMHLGERKLTYYTGNYDTYIQTRADIEEHQMKRYQWEQKKMQDYKDYIAKYGHGSAKLARQAKSREKAMSRMAEKGLTQKVLSDRNQSFYFPPCEDIPPPVLQFTEVYFSYDGDKNSPDRLFTKLDFGVDLDSRIAFVGPNGAGKSTFLKLMVGDLTPTDGIVKKHQHLRIGWYHQHLSEKLDGDLTPLEYMRKEFPKAEGGEEAMRRAVGRYGVTGSAQTTPIKILSDGQKSRLVFAWLAYQNPQLLLLDEPTNHLDMETIDALADAINDFDGGVVVISHDFRLIDAIAEEIWEVKNRQITRWQGEIFEYKEHLRSLLEED